MWRYSRRMNTRDVNLEVIGRQVAACRLCADRFERSATAHRPRPVFWLSEGARILVAGQAPGMRVHESGRPFDDRSGERLRDWMGIDRAVFYDRSRIAVLPMAFCFPGYNRAGSDLPPPRLCRMTWHDRVMAAFGEPALVLAIGAHAQKYHIGSDAKRMTDTVRNWRAHCPRIFPLPHPSWRNTGWLKQNPWFETDLLPALRKRVGSVLATYGNRTE